MIQTAILYYYNCWSNLQPLGVWLVQRQLHVYQTCTHKNAMYGTVFLSLGQGNTLNRNLLASPQAAERIWNLCLAKQTFFFPITPGLYH